jgi:hypothetical protein
MEGLSGLSQATRDLLGRRTKPHSREQSTKEVEGELHKKLKGAVPGVFNVMQKTPY